MLRSSFRWSAETTTRRKEERTMRCPYCGDRRTEVLKTVYRGHNSYRHRRCLYCGSRFGTQERPVRWSRVERKWPGSRPLRNGWGNRRTPALRGKCEVESCGVDFKQAGTRRPCGPHRSGETHPTTKRWESRRPRKPSVHLRRLPWVQAPSRPQAVLRG